MIAEKMCYVPQDAYGYLADIAISPVMYLFQGNYTEIPQRTHVWNNDKFIRSRYVDSLSNEYIDEVIVSRQSQLQKCWLSRLKDSPGLKGQIVLQFEISRRGKVRDLRVVDTTFDDDTLKRCVVTVFERLTFRPFKGQEITLSYPVAFE